MRKAQTIEKAWEQLEPSYQSISRKIGSEGALGYITALTMLQHDLLDEPRAIFEGFKKLAS